MSSLTTLGAQDSGSLSRTTINNNFNTLNTDKLGKVSATTLTDAATVTINSDVTSLGVLLTLSQTTDIANPTGTPVNGQILVLRIKSTSSRSLTYGSQFRGGDITLPSATTGSSKTDYLGFMYNSTDTKWDLVAKALNY